MAIVFYAGYELRLPSDGFFRSDASAGKTMVGWLCPVCGCQERPAVCASCINSILEERQKDLKVLKQTRTHFRERLDAKLEQRRELERQRFWWREQNERCERLRQAYRVAEASFQKEKAKLQEKQAVVETVSVRLSEAQRQLAGKKTELESHSLVLRAQTLSLAVVVSEVTHMQRSALRQLCNIFPLRLAVVDVPEAWDGAQKLSQAVRICGVRLPEGEGPLGMPASELAAALGYLLQFLQLAAKYLSAPVLHSSGFAVSSSKVWQRAGYWNHRPDSLSHVYPLYLPRPGSASKSDGEVSPSEPLKGFFGTQALPGGASPVVGGPGQKSSNGSSPVVSGTAGSNQEGRDSRPLRKGLVLVKRSIMCLCSYEESLLSLKLPRQFPPFASLALLMEWLTRDPRSSGHLSRSKNMDLATSSGYGSIQVGKSSLSEAGALFVGPPEEFSSTQFQSFVQSAMDTGSTFDDGPKVGGMFSPSTENGLEEWDLVERPPLPPPPSKAEDVEHWTRAMFIDATR